MINLFWILLRCKLFQELHLLSTKKGAITLSFHFILAIWEAWWNFRTHFILEAESGLAGVCTIISRSQVFNIMCVVSYFLSAFFQAWKSLYYCRYKLMFVLVFATLPVHQAHFWGISYIHITICLRWFKLGQVYNIS